MFLLANIPWFFVDCSVRNYSRSISSKRIDCFLPTWPDYQPVFAVNTATKKQRGISKATHILDFKKKNYNSQIFSTSFYMLS
jgi:hypothetical protein